MNSHLSHILPLHSILDLLTIITFLFLLSQAKDTLNLGESLRENDTLISEGGNFELGFFARSNSNHRYVGICYHGFSSETNSWVANRERPIIGPSGALTLDRDGNLIINDGTNVLWSTNISVQNNESTVARLLDTGNLVLNNLQGMTIWQSFDHPTDTYIPGMRVGMDIRTGVNQVFRSWRSENDPSPGNFTLGIDPDGSTQLYVWDGSRPRWRSGRWDGQIFIGIEKMIPSYMYAFKMSNYDLEKKMYFYTTFNLSHRYLISSDGIDEHLIWSDSTKAWIRLFAQPTTPCEFYNRCGDYATCIERNDNTGIEPVCECLKGHVPVNETEWSKGIVNSGCVRRVPLKCEKGGFDPAGRNGTIDGFWRIKNMKLPDLSVVNADEVDEAGCHAKCLTNCSCKAYSFVSGIGCLIWNVHLVDMHIFTGGGGNDMFLRLDGTELGKRKKAQTMIITVTTLSSGLVLLGCVYLCWRYINRRKGFTAHKKESRGGSNNPNGNERIGDEWSDVIKITHEGKQSRELPLLSYDCIASATEKFSSRNLLGEGGFGPVYKGVFAEGQEVAVKRLSKNSGQGLEEFKNEVILIAKLQHRNLVRLLGCCLQDEEKILIYEFMPNKSLDIFLFDPHKKRLLDWKTRYNIIEGIARGLLYLHRDSRLRVIHRDLKVSNILLDEEMNPKISDFGLARIFGNDDSESNNTRRVVGTYGYMSPEYAMQGIFSVKSDVYSFGVLLLEIISGRKNTTYYNHEFSLYLLGYAWKLWHEDNLIKLVEPAIRNSCSLNEVATCVNVGLLCVQDHVNDRPTMSSVLIMLEAGVTAISPPKEPTFSAVKGPTNTDSSTFELANASISMFIGR